MGKDKVSETRKENAKVAFLLGAILFPIIYGMFWGFHIGVILASPFAGLTCMSLTNAYHHWRQI